MIAARLLVAGIVLALAGACARGRPTLPAGDGTPFPGVDAIYAEATARCRDARSVMADLRLSGRAGDQRLRGTVTAALEAPSRIRLEGVAPFGSPLFFLVARDASATLLLPRDNAVVRNEPPAAIIEALAGVALSPAELRAAIAGCGLGASTASNGRRFADDWVAVDGAGGTTYLRQVDRRWVVAGAVREPVTLVYSSFSSGRASTMHVRSGAVADITLRVSQLEINTSIPDKAFDVKVPADARPLTLEELRRAGPLGDRSR